MRKTILFTAILALAACKKDDKTVEYQVDSPDAIVTWYNEFHHGETIVVKGSFRKLLRRVEHDYQPMINVRPAPGSKAEVHILVDGEVWRSSNTATYSTPYQHP